MCDIIEEKKLGEGYYGDVYKVSKNEQSFALKKYKHGSFYSLKEIDIMFRIKNKHLIRGIELSSNSKCPDIFDKSQSGIVQNLISGDIINYLETHKGTMTQLENVKLACKALLSVCLALRCLLSAGYYHLDIKPDNIFFEQIDGEYNFYLGDYGACIALDAKGSLIQYEESRSIGTKEFFPPEYYKRDKLYYYSSSSWPTALAIMAMVTGSDHFSYFEDIGEIDFVNQWYDDSTDNAVVAAGNDRKCKELTLKLLDILGGMIEPNPAERLNPSDVISIFESDRKLDFTKRGLGEYFSGPCEIETPTLNLQESDFRNIQWLYFALRETDITNFTSIRDVGLALSQGLRLMKKGFKIDDLMIRKLLEFATYFYGRIYDFKAFKDENEKIEFIESLDKILFFNPVIERNIYMNLALSEKKEDKQEFISKING